MVNKKISLEYLLLFSVFVIATCGLIYELVAGALASYLMGDSVKQFSFIIGVYLFAMGIGSYLSKFIEGNLISKFIEIEILVGLLGGISSTVLFWLFNTTGIFEVALYLFVFSIGCLVGLEIPILLNILKDKVSFKDLVSNVFAFDYIGALFASILFPLVFIPKLGIIKTPIFFGIINIAVAIFIIFYLKDEINKSKVWLKIKAFGTLFILIFLYIYSNQILSVSEAELYNEAIIFSKNSTYQRLVVTRNENETKLYLNNNLQFSSTDEYRYHEALVHPVMSKSIHHQNVLVLGGGDGFAVREILKYNTVKNITLVDLDPDVTTFFKENLLMTKLNNNALNHAKLEIINQDAFIWVKNQTKKFDVIIIDFPDPSNYSLGKLYTLQFYNYLKKITTNQTKICIQSTSPYFAPKSFWCINKTVNHVFPFTKAYHVYVPSFGEWGFCMASFEPIKNNNFYQIKGNKFYDYDLEKLTHFSQDMTAKNLETNRLDNQIIVRYFDEEWGKIH
jgi:spermidine synthase